MIFIPFYYCEQFETRVQFDAATQLRHRRSLWPDFEFNRSKIDPDYRAAHRLPSSRSAPRCSALNARNTRSLNVPNACRHGYTCQGDYVCARDSRRSSEDREIAADRGASSLLREPRFFPLFPSIQERRDCSTETDVTINLLRDLEQLFSNEFSRSI